MSQKQAIAGLFWGKFGERIPVLELLHPFPDSFKTVLRYGARIYDFRKTLPEGYKVIEGEKRVKGSRRTYYILTDTIDNLPPLP